MRSVIYFHESQFEAVIQHLQSQGYEVVGEYFDDVYMERDGHIYELRKA